MSPEDFERLNQNHPYLTYVKFLDEELVGIVQNMGTQLLSIYVYNYLTNDNMKSKFLDLGRLWWEDSNHLIPINIFLREEFYLFKSILKCYSKKDIEDIKGPVLSLEDNFQKRIKRKRIQLVRKLED